MTDTAKLVERLRRGREGAPTWNDILNLCDEAADAIEALSSAQADTDARVKAAVEAERERCLSALEAYGNKRLADATTSFEPEVGHAVLGAAAAIRAGKEASHDEGR